MGGPKSRPGIDEAGPIGPASLRDHGRAGAGSVRAQTDTDAPAAPARTLSKQVLQ